MDNIIVLKGTQLEAFLAYLQGTADPLITLRIGIDDGGVKLSGNWHSWTRPLGEPWPTVTPSTAPDTGAPAEQSSTTTPTSVPHVEPPLPRFYY